MKVVHIVTEGRSETNFVKRVLVPYFWAMDKNLIPNETLTKVDRSKGRMYKGGLSHYEKMRETIRKCLGYTKKADTFVTTMFDLYGLPDDTPGMDKIKNCANKYEAVGVIEREMAVSENLSKAAFFPYIQLHEFEALLFTNLDFLAESYFEYDIQPLRDCLAKKKNPELINDGKPTAPSKRILSCIPIYDKVTVGVAILEKIGVDALCASCKHFSEWIDRIKSL